MLLEHISKVIIGHLLLLSGILMAQEPLERAVLISSEIRNDSVHLNWNVDDSAEQYLIFSRTLNSTTWGDPIAALLATASSYSIPLALGESREIAIFKSDPFIYRDTISAPMGNYQIILEDQFGKGLCCDFGIGFFRIKDDTQILYEAGDFDFELLDSFEHTSNSDLYLEIQPDLFGNHLGWELLNYDSDSLVSSFGPLGTFLRRAPSLGIIAVANKPEVDIPNESVLILVADNLMPDLTAELATLSEDLQRSGLFPKVIAVSLDSSSTAIKSIIQSQADSLENLSTLYLIGHVPVPYSGDMYPDTHSDMHKGAWAADLYYADLDGIFTDTEVNEASGFFERTHNIPGDGKFDQSLIPSDLELAMGRIDFSDMGVISDDELMLTKQYLQKAHDWKIGLIEALPNGLIDDNFGKAFGAPASNGWRNLAALLGPENVEEEDFLTNLGSESHLWAYGCGSGTQISCEGVANTQELAEDSLQVIFLMTFGSNFGDWDNHDNFLRAPLASGTTLSNAWVGNPHWFMHQMGVGKNIGSTTLKNMNSHYLPGPQLMHMALMGDPTVNQYPLKSIPETTINQTAGDILINWEAPTLADDYQYAIYHRLHADSTWQQINNEPITQLSFTHSSATVGPNYYLIRPSKLITNNSGCFYQAGLGSLLEIEFVIITPTDEIEISALRIWPNPGNKYLNIENLNIGDSLKIYNQQGNLIFDRKTGTSNEQLIIEDWSNGVYFIKIGEEVERFVKMGK